MPQEANREQDRQGRGNCDRVLELRGVKAYLGRVDRRQIRLELFVHGGVVDGRVGHVY